MKEIILSPKEASKYFGVHTATLRRWDKENRIKVIRTKGGDRRYVIEQDNKYKICYCRVSSYKQKEDLQRQIRYMREKYPNAEIIKDIGSGLNFRRKGLYSILERAIKGDCIILYIAHKDRIARFGFELIKRIIERSGGKVVVLNEISLSPEEELTKDLLSILHVFSCRLHGLRDYSKQISKDLSHKRTEDKTKTVA